MPLIKKTKKKPHNEEETGEMKAYKIMREIFTSDY